MNAEQRRRLMSRFRSKDTKPEVLVRKALHHAGRRFRLHVKDLPGKPDIVLRKDRTVVMVHGCFWHQHEGCSVARLPKSNPDFWREKFALNRGRDVRVQKELEQLGWRVVTIWECEAKSPGLAQLLTRLGLVSADRAGLTY
ncbi:very short patch repair endonuclease [Sphingomonas sp. CFBP 13733]|uniref:very short patch repair endonuclease n=1 Tax=Sphingomonas sp. CFBP 13733 TaxID=2775291 RepID=UPI00237BDCFE|nr:very short patch repair endonuclease [Sphingomonas sp. CFBP 13733]